MKIIKFFTVILSMVLVYSCSKKEDEPQLPMGENTAYYYVDGQLVVPKGYTDYGLGRFITPITFNGCIAANNGIVVYFNNNTEYFQLYIRNGVLDTGLQTLNVGGNDSACYYSSNFGFLSIKSAAGTPRIEYTTKGNSGEVNITKLSADKRKFSGTFKATLYDANGQKVEITSGVFDINLDTL